MAGEELIQRWDTYLSKLKERYTEIISQAEEPLKEVIENLQFDNVIIINIKTGLQNQAVLQVYQKAEEGWGKMQGEIYKSGKLFLIKQEAVKLQTLREWLDTEFMKFEVGLFARAARKILENVKQHINEKKIHRCTQCAAELPINIYSFMAINLKCDSCGAVNTYQPDDRIRALEYYVIEPLADEYALEPKLRRDKDKNANKESFRMYYTYLMEHVPEKREAYQRTLDERLNNPFFS
ncbi:MAG: hypothetical protein LWX07_06135 [Bacteroidetes bacterium]|nr:hypothetical protein [Bacteroidota bacterium]